ncbi:nicotinate phosphoribosyltransferase, partial [Candidatus Woesearchaeota archaeon]|nr:nicotinate phosphoribosyltransferase [Candidatus Woesearchaeota archaeon]
PYTPILRVTAKRTQAQLLETTLLNIINFQTMIATKASRVAQAANGAKVVDFGLRRAQEEDAGMKGARAAYIGGAVATSNVKAGKEYGIPIAGTHAHSFVMSFPTELDAFRAYVKTFPENATLLIDTYDTVQGARNAAIVAKELVQQGKKLGAVRLDSGDLLDLSQKVRKILDEEGLQYVKIFASGDLNEYKIAELVKNKAPIDGYGVGTELITAKPVAAIAGVYKLVEDGDGAKIKLSPGKQTCPGKKQVYRISDAAGNYSHDVLALEGECREGTPLLELIVQDGKRTKERRNLTEIQRHALDCVAKLPEYVKQVRVETSYCVEISSRLQKLVGKLTERYANNHLGGEAA